MVEILLAVYNGENFLKEQLNSILNQSYCNWKLLIYNDGSLDGSKKILEEYAKKHKDKIKCLNKKTNSKSAVVAFKNLLKLSKEKYVCFCDQDDVWHKDKLKLSLNKMKELEKKEKEKPILIYTDLIVVDEKLKILKSSFAKFQHFSLKEKPLKRLIVQNNITGCTVLINKSLVKICGEIPKKALMHDWWLGLVALCFGKTFFLNKKTVYYRQHKKNLVGAKNVFSFKYLLKKLLNKKAIKNSINSTYLQCEEFLKKYGFILEKEKKEVFKKYLKIKDCKKLEKILRLISGGFLKDGLFRKIAQIFYI